MSNAIHRAILLYQHSRYAEAEQELRRLLADQPQDASAHSLLGLCLAKQEKLDDAQAEVEQAIVLAPDEARSHYCRSIVLEQRNRYAEAEDSALEAVRLDPADADNYARLAVTLYNQSKWQAALNTVEQGLAHDAENADCSNLRTLALTKLGRRQEAIANVDQALARDPDDAFAHTNKGWTLLHQGKPKEALVHFREALRLDPTFEYARVGMVEALKAKNPVYRWMLGYFLWMGRLSDRARWGVILGGWFGAKVLRQLADTNEGLRPWITPILLVYLAFVLLTWFAMPLFNLLLRLHPTGRHALSRDQRISSNWFGACAAVFVLCMAAYAATGQDVIIVPAALALGLALPLTAIYHCDPGWPRRSMGWYTIALAAVGLLAFAGAIYEETSGAEMSWAMTAFYLFLFGAIVTPWVANYLMTATAKR
jgi:tetratricopeptide (TPR) repeat protein